MGPRAPVTDRPPPGDCTRLGDGQIQGGEMAEWGLRREGCNGRGCGLVRVQVPVHERVLDFQAVDRDAGWGRGSQDQLRLVGSSA